MFQRTKEIVTLSVWRFIRQEPSVLVIYYTSKRVSNRHGFSPVIWLRASSAPPTAHAVLPPSFTLVSRHPPQVVLHCEHLAVFTDVKERDCSSCFNFADQMPD